MLRTLTGGRGRPCSPAPPVRLSPADTDHGPAGGAGGGFPLHGGICLTQDRVSAKHIAHRQVVAQRQAAIHDQVGIGPRKPFRLLECPALRNARFALRGETQRHQDAAGRRHVSLAGHDVAVDDGLGRETGNSCAPDVLDRLNRHPCRSHGRRVVRAQGPGALRPGRVILHDGDHQLTIRAAQKPASNREGLLFGLQFTTVQCHPGKPGPGWWSSLNRSGRPRPELLGTEIPAFAKPTFERFRRARHAAQYFKPFPSWLCFAELQYVGGPGELTGAPGGEGPGPPEARPRLR